MPQVGKIHETRDGFEWRISNFWKLSKENESCESPDIYYNNVQWLFVIYPNGVSNAGYVKLHLVKCNGVPITINFALALKTGKEEKYVERHYTENFEEGFDYSAYPWFISMSELKEKRTELVPSRVLTVLFSPVISKSASEDLKSLRQMYKEVLVNGQNHDVILKVGDKEFPAHRDILGARSRVFKDMLNNSVKEKNNEVVDVSDCNPNAVEQFLLYIYCGTVETLDESSMFGLYYLSNKYDIPPLKSLSRDFIIKSMSPTNICDVILGALNQDESNLLECTTEYFCNNLDNILNTAGWQSFMKDNCTLANDLLKKAVFKLQNPKAKELITID